MADDKDKLTVYDARIIFRNFRGKGSKFNDEGTRNFGVILPDPEAATRMQEDSWNVKWLEPREDEGETEPTPWLPVEVAYDKGRPPRIVLITSKKRTDLEEEDVAGLDWVDILTVDMIIRGSRWEVNGRKACKAYLRSMYMTIEEDELAQKYAELPTDSE